MAQQNGKKPVSNLSSALASIHISRNTDSYNSNSNSNSHLHGSDERTNNDLMRYHNDSSSMTGLNPDNDLLMNEQNYRIPQSIDIPMRSQNDFVSQLPLDRIAQYRKNPPTEGISLFSHRSAPNGFKVAVVLAELGIKFRTFFLDFKKNEQRSPYYISMNPNARVPAIIDHDNGDHAVWESGAILIYLCQRAGRDCPIWSDDFTEQSTINSWLFFQASGHAPMIGQALHFRYFHPEMIPSAVERYTNEVRRIYGVVEMRLAELRESMIMEMDDERFSLGTSALSESKYFDDPVWLVGNRITVADLSFVTWNHVVDRIGIILKNEYPEVYKWTNQMLDRPQVIRALSGLESN